MESKIEEIYYDAKGLLEKIKPGEEYEKISEEFWKLYNDLENGLDEKQKKLLDDLFGVASNLERETGFSNFKEGFKTGLLIAIEGLS